MKLDVLRFKDNGDTTLGMLMINGVFAAFTLEDEERTIKVWGETRIPEGEYKIGLRVEGGHHARYSKKFPSFHKGMLQVLDVPNFQYILIHIGNDDDDTAGCLLLGSSSDSKSNTIGQSTVRYAKVYKQVVEAINSGEEVTIAYEKIYV